MNRGSIPRYLRLLGITDLPHGLDGLRLLVRQHLTQVPFENISKLMQFDREGVGRPMTLEEFLDGIEGHDFGGTCYSSNPFLAELLQGLGYEATLLGADMATPNVHTSVRVRLDSTAYHVDVGYAAPFHEPIALNRLPYAVAHGHHRYVLDRRQVEGSFELKTFDRDAHVHGYVVHPPPRTFDFFRQTIVDSFERGRTFMRCLRITRFFADHTVELRNRRLIVYRGTESRETTINSLAELRYAVDMDMLMPRCPVERAVSVLERLTGAPFFGEQPWADSM